MNKLASFVTHYQRLGQEAAFNQLGGREKTAFLSKLLPKSRLGKLGLGAAGLLGAGAAYKSTREEPSTLENLYEGGKDTLSNMSQEELMGYADLIARLGRGDTSGLMGYSADQQVDPSMYAMTDIAQDPYASMGYEAQMSPEEAQAYLQYYS